jgi:lipopolysaccharide export LptBFGC system permease protein LptF
MTFVLAITLMLTALLGGCAKPPTEEMENAEAALTRAENDPDAVAYGNASIIRARDALANMHTEAAAKRYDAAKSYAQDVINAAERAIADGKTGSQRAREEASASLNGARASLGETQRNIDAAKEVTGIQLDFNGIDGDYAAARNQTDQAQNALNAADYKGSLERSQSARSLLGDINARISQASIATSQKK